MRSEIASKKAALDRLCVRYRVQQLELFGSAAGARFDPDRSDLDFLVKFHSMAPAEHARCYFGLLEALEALFQRPVDLVEVASLTNPYFLAAIEPTRETICAG